MLEKNQPKKQTKNGLFKRGKVWHIDKHINGRRICRSTGTTDQKVAERVLAKLTGDSYQAKQFGTRPGRTFDQAAAEYLFRNSDKRSYLTDISRLDMLQTYSGLFELHIHDINNDSLAPWITVRRDQGRSNGTINHGIKLVKQILKQATRWTDENNQTWLERMPDIDLLPNPPDKKRQAYPMNWSEQDRLFEALPDHLRKMALFAVNTGTRDGEICNLQWAWEEPVPQLNTSVFRIPPEYVKNNTERFVVLNSIATEIVEQCRGQHDTHVFSYPRKHGRKPITRMLNSSWMRVREKVSLPEVRVHDLKHTFGARLKRARVSFEIRQELLGHRSQNITEHYSAADLQLLIDSAESVCPKNLADKADTIVLRRK